jgi:hypothetical protein
MISCLNAETKEKDSLFSKVSRHSDKLNALDKLPHVLKNLHKTDTYIQQLTHSAVAAMIPILDRSTAIQTY